MITIVEKKYKIVWSPLRVEAWETPPSEEYGGYSTLNIEVLDKLYQFKRDPSRCALTGAECETYYVYLTYMGRPLLHDIGLPIGIYIYKETPREYQDYFDLLFH